MSPESLPDELLVAISKELPSFPDPSNSFGTFPIVDQDPVLRALCATNKRLRSIFVRELYANVVFNLSRKALEVHLKCVRRFLRVTKTQGASQFIRTIHLRVSESLPLQLPQYLHFRGNTTEMSMETALIYRIVQLTLYSATNLISLDMTRTTTPLTTEIFEAINSHSRLQNIILEDVQQLCFLPLTLLSSTSLSRLHFRKAGLTYEMGTPHDVLRAILSRESDGPRIDNLELQKPFSPAWTSLTIKGLRSLHVQWSDIDFAPSCGAFFDRHTQLEDIHLSGAGLRDIRAIERVPLLSSLYEVASVQGLLDAFWVDKVHVLNEYLDRSEQGLHLRKVRIRITKRPAEVVAFLLENLPVFEDLHLVCDADPLELRNFVPISDLWDMVLSSTCNLQHLRHLRFTKFPFWNDPNDVPSLRPIPPSTDDWDGEVEYPPELKEHIETMKSRYVDPLVGRCPSLTWVSVRRPEMEGAVGADGFVFKIWRERRSRRVEAVEMKIREGMPLP